MSYGLRISEFSSLNFSEWKHDFEIDECYVQPFSIYDNIRVQLSILDSYEITLRLVNIDNNATEIISLDTLGSEDDYTIYSFQYSGLSLGHYRVDVLNSFDEIVSYSLFNIVPREELEGTLKIRYTHRENDYDVYFVNGDDYNYFDFRVEGGFLYNEIQFQSDVNFFRDQRYAGHILSAYPYETRKLTIGKRSGVPVWVARKLNLIFCLSYTLINGEYYTRSESSNPEIIKQGELYPLYVIKIDLDVVNFYSYNIKEYPFVYSILATEDKKILGTEDMEGMLIENN